MRKPKFQVGNKVVELNDQSTIMTITKVGGNNYRAALRIGEAIDFDGQYECERSYGAPVPTTFDESQLKQVGI